jgi:hypothetical protein
VIGRCKRFGTEDRLCAAPHQLGSAGSESSGQSVEPYYEIDIE